MSRIQFLLMAGILALGLAGSHLLGARLVSRLVMLTLVCMGMFLVAVPEATTIVARYLGVGRGTDLLLYLSILTGGYAIILLYARTRRLERKLTDHVRQTAIRNAREPQ